MGSESKNTLFLRKNVLFSLLQIFFKIKNSKNNLKHVLVTTIFLVK